MKLRTQLILVLLLLTVLPLGTVTIYSYMTNKATLQQAAEREADLMANELSARMQLITTEIGDRVSRLAEMQQARNDAAADAAANAQVTKASLTRTQPSAADVVPATPDALVPQPAETQIASALGEAAMMLNSVELQGGRGFGPRPRPGVTPGATPSATPRSMPGTPPNAPSGARASSPPSSGGSADAATSRTSLTTMPANGGLGRSGRGRGNGNQRTARGTTDSPDTPTVPVAPAPRGGATPAPGSTTPSSPPSGASSSTTTSVAAGGSTTISGRGGRTAPQADDTDPSRIVIDMGAITREMVKNMAPEGSMANLSPEERQRVSREMGLRLMGITEGLKIGAAELQKKADLAKQRAAEDALVARPKPPADTALGPTRTKAALKGNKIGVTVERNGKVVNTANAEINLDQVLMTVFSTTGRDRGEVPFAVAKDGKLYTAVPSDKAVVEALGPAVKPDGPLGRTTLPDWIVVTTKDPSGSGLRFGIARPVGDSMSDLRHRASRNAGLGLALICLALVGVAPLSARLTRNLSSLTDGVQNIARGDYTTRVPVKSNDEMGMLATAFNQMAEDVQEHQKSLLSQERLKRELELGRQIQNEMLPHEPLRLGLTEVKGVSVPAREVGGDFFNYFALPSGEIALLVGDVSGKGVGAALVMANIQATLRTRLAMGQDLTVITDAIDRELEASTRAAYATLIVGIFSPITRRIRFVNAGHHPQFVLRADGTTDQMSSTGTPVGLLSGRGYEQSTLQLGAGDFIFFYTDGLVEAENELGEFYGSELLESTLIEANKATNGSIDEVFQRVEASIAAFRGTREAGDDATMMAVRIG